MLETYANYVIIPITPVDHGSGRETIESNYGYYDSFIYTDKEETLAWFGDSENWRQLAYDSLCSEIDTLNMWLHGEVYIRCIEEFCGGAWNNADYVGGYYSDKWGDALYDELNEEQYTLHDSITKAVPSNMREIYKSFDEKYGLTA